MGQGKLVGRGSVWWVILLAEAGIWYWLFVLFWYWRWCVLV